MLLLYQFTFLFWNIIKQSSRIFYNVLEKIYIPQTIPKDMYFSYDMK